MNLLPLYPSHASSRACKPYHTHMAGAGCCLILIMCLRVQRALGTLHTQEMQYTNLQTAACCLIPLERLTAREVDSWKPRDEHARPRDRLATNDRYARRSRTPSFQLTCPATRFLLKTKSRTSRHLICSTLFSTLHVDIFW
jgi:hypothetical protein